MKIMLFPAIAYLLIGNVRAETDPMLIKLNCQICHQPAVASSNLQRQSPEKILAALKDFKTGKRPSLIMQRLVKGLAASELSQVAALAGRKHDD